jgi:hypothetical protein
MSNFTTPNLGANLGPNRAEGRGLHALRTETAYGAKPGTPGFTQDGMEPPMSEGMLPAWPLPCGPEW